MEISELLKNLEKFYEFSGTEKAQELMGDEVSDYHEILEICKEIVDSHLMK